MSVIIVADAVRTILQALARLMPKALELYKQSDVYKQTIARRLQKKQEADKARTTEVAEKKQDKQYGIEGTEGGMLPSASKPVTEQVRLV
jgi:hypothetical protein